MSQFKCGWVAACLAFAMVGCAATDDGSMPGEQADQGDELGGETPAADELPPRDELGASVIDGVQQAISASAFGAFVPVPTGLTDEAPAVISRGASIEAYVRGLGGQLHYNYWSTWTGWLGWSALGGVLTSKPAATAIRSLGMAVVVRGEDSGFWIRVSLPPAGAGSGHPVTGPWLRIPGGTFKFAPAIAFHDDELLVFGVRTDDKMYVSRNTLTRAPAGGYTFDNGAWSAWQSLGGVFLSEPAVAVSSGGSRIYVAGRGGDRRFYVATSYNGTTYTGWTAAPSGVYSSGPALAPRSGEMNLFGRGLDGAFWVATATSGGFSAPSRIASGLFDRSPAAAAVDGDVYVFGTGLDERIYYARGR